MKPRIKTVKSWAQVDDDGNIRISTMASSLAWVPPLNEEAKKHGWTIRRIKITGV